MERTEAVLIEQRLALALAQEYLAATNIACRPVEGLAAGVISMSLLIPDRPLHA